MLAPNGGINHKLPSSKELRYASTEMHKNAPKAEIILFFKSTLLSLSILEQRFTRPCNSLQEFLFLLKSLLTFLDALVRLPHQDKNKTHYC